MPSDKLFLRLHSLGLIKPLVRYLVTVRRQILGSVYYNTDLITNQLAVLDMLTDGRIHRIPSLKKFIGKGAVDAAMIQLEDVLKKYTGFQFVYPVAQGRQAEQLLTGVLEPAGKTVITNGLFISTYYHTTLQGAEILELPRENNSDATVLFGGDIDMDAFQHALERSPTISHVYLECCNNALGGKPISYANLERVAQLCREKKIPLLLDATRMLQNVELIRRHEKGFAKKKVTEIARMLFDLADACTISSTKEMNIDAGGIIALRNKKLAVALRDQLMLQGEGLSVYAKARMSKAYASVGAQGSRIRKQIGTIAKVVEILQRSGLPVVLPPGGVGLYLRCDELTALPVKDPERAFLVDLYERSGIVGAVNYSTPRLSERNICMLRFVITPEMRNMHYFTRHLIRAWKERGKLRGLEKTYQPEGKAGEYFARYTPMSHN